MSYVSVYTRLYICVNVHYHPFFFFTCPSGFIGKDFVVVVDYPKPFTCNVHLEDINLFVRINFWH